MSKIETNNTSLEEILETINNLPEAGGSGSGNDLEIINIFDLPTECPEGYTDYIGGSYFYTLKGDENVILCRYEDSDSNVEYDACTVTTYINNEGVVKNMFYNSRFEPLTNHPNL